ncbi:GGDEF domain-containing protein [Dyella sp. A6]|uniref:tetratricopeptide repeat-containing diguanylate cyclase n=1 Tax=Dyella aluminiiresistens TaxID=3069105 RepID=UPI002E75ACF6|nr:GGDEF domain-containing protein [Dyella sp. A6]
MLAALLMLPVLVHGQGMSARDALRYRTETDPHALIADIRQQLDRQTPPMGEPETRERLWLMGTAAVNVNDDAALTEATVMLDDLAQQNHDPAAAADAGFLRSRQMIATGEGDGVSEELQAVARVQGTTDPLMLGRMRYTLCDAYAMSEEFDRAVPLCRQAIDTYRSQHDLWGQGNAENDLGIVYTNLGRYAAAIKVYLSGRRHFAQIGAQEMVVLVGDNLSQAYRKTGRVREALPLSQASLKQELKAGRISDAFGSRMDIALDYEAMGQRQHALELMDSIIRDARAQHIHGLLPDELEQRSRLEAAMGKLRPALDDMREVAGDLDVRNTAVLRSDEAELEARYATREKELQILSLKRENQLKDLQLKAAQAEAARRDEARRREALGSLLTKIVAVGGALVALLLFLLLHAQRRHAAELRAQAQRDPLTGIENRRAFQQRVDALLARPLPSPLQAHVLLLIDVDHFKRVNDQAGHAQGDLVLTIVTSCLCRVSGAAGHVARIGGEEFVVLCPDMGAEAGMRLAETLRAEMAAMPLPADAKVSRITISIGVAVFDGVRCHDISSWMRSADQALYEAKAHGRNRVVASTLVT